jgi:hypothetical protein
MENGSRYFEYTMGDTRINSFFSFLSGRFNVKRDNGRTSTWRFITTPVTNSTWTK